MHCRAREMAPWIKVFAKRASGPEFGSLEATIKPGGVAYTCNTSAPMVGGGESSWKLPGIGTREQETVSSKMESKDRY